MKPARHDAMVMKARRTRAEVDAAIGGCSDAEAHSKHTRPIRWAQAWQGIFQTTPRHLQTLTGSSGFTEQTQAPGAHSISSPIHTCMHAYACMGANHERHAARTHNSGSTEVCRPPVPTFARKASTDGMHSYTPTKVSRSRVRDAACSWLSASACRAAARPCGGNRRRDINVGQHQH